jgi:hypothetical protein
MSYDFDYHAGVDIEYPFRPKRPTLKSNPTSVDALAYANALAEYETAFAEYNEEISIINREKTARMSNLKGRMQKDYCLNDMQFEILWTAAWESGHDHGLAEVASHFDDFYDLVTRWESASSQKS